MVVRGGGGGGCEMSGKNILILFVFSLVRKYEHFAEKNVTFFYAPADLKVCTGYNEVAHTKMW